jgi:hypothetical protein
MGRRKGKRSQVLKYGSMNSSASNELSSVIPAGFKRESSGTPSWIPAKARRNDETEVLK